MNQKKFVQEFRDQVIVKAIENRIDEVKHMTIVSIQNFESSRNVQKNKKNKFEEQNSFFFTKLIAVMILYNKKLMSKLWS